VPLQGNNSQTIPWRKLSVRQIFEGCFLLALYWILRLLPIDVCSGVGSFMGRVIGPRLRLDSNVRKNIAKLRPEASKQEQERLVRSYRSHMGRIITEFAALQRLWRSDRVEIIGKENFTQAKETKRPIIFLSIHTGNYDLVGPQIIDVLGQPGFNVYGEHSNVFIKKITNQIRGPYKKHLISSKRRFASKTIYDGFLKGNCLLVALDDAARAYPSFGRFGCGHLTKSNLVRAIRMAKKVNGLFIPVYCLRTKGAYFALHLLPPIDLDFSDFNEEKLTKAINHIDELMGSIVRQHIDQWYWTGGELYQT
jgi:KDO2-lipid IV(A) lauroyltransferase